MAFSNELAALLQRDLTRLVQEVQAFPSDEILWKVLPGVTNSAGNLTLHLEGNLREFIGRQLGQIDFQRDRPAEFGSSGRTRAELVRGIEAVRDTIPAVVARLNAETLAASFPEKVLTGPLPAQQFLMHVYGHLSYHLGQIDYLRRILTTGEAIPFASL